MNAKQAIPHSITGKEDIYVGSVLEHAFGRGDPYTLGVEEEYQLLDSQTFDLVQHIETMLAAVSGHELEPRINAELMQSVLEIATRVCRTAGDVMRELARLRSFVTGVARARLLRVGSAGTNKFLAARYGLEAPVMDLGTGRRNRIPISRLVRRTLAEVEPHARELGSERELDGIREILGRGTGADRQLRTFRETGDVTAVAREIADVTEAIPVPV